MSEPITIFSEKPSQARAYAEAYKIKEKTKKHIELEKCNTFPDGAYITWGYGHLVGLQMPQDYKEEWSKWSLNNLPIIPENFQYKIQNQEQMNHIKELFDRSKVIINASDLDREGSNIFYSIYNMTGVKNKTIKRLWINSLEVEEVRKGFNNLQDNKKDLLMYEEAKTRQIADWLVGINGSQLYTLLLQQKGMNGVFSVGRVQTVLTYLIYQRDKEIKEFVSKPFYELESDFEHDNGIYKGKAKIKEDDKDNVKKILDNANVEENILQNAIIKEVNKTLKNTKPPKLHSLSTLQSKANKLWKYNPTKVLEIVQKLYEKKIVSYPRTDCNYITEAEFEYLKNNVEEYQKIINVSFQANKEPNKRFINSQKVQEHYALVPTKNIPSDNTINNLSNEEKNIYLELLATTLGMFHQDYKYEETHVITNINDIEFHTKGNVEIDKGWKELFPRNTKDNKKEKEPLPIVSENDKVSANPNIVEGFSTPPKPYTEGQLINLMKTAGRMIDDEKDSDILKEVEGIGTEATRSGIIETVKEKEYIKINKNIVNITEKGEILSEAVEGTLLSSPSMTAKWESYLKKIGEGNGTQEHFLNNIKRFLLSTIENATKQIDKMDNKIQKYNESKGIVQCPACNGYINDKGKFYGCSGYQDGCKVTLPKKLKGKTLSAVTIKTLCTKKETKKLKGFTGKKGKFDTKLILNDKNEIKFDFSK